MWCYYRNQNFKLADSFYPFLSLICIREWMLRVGQVKLPLVPLLAVPGLPASVQDDGQVRDAPLGWGSSWCV